MVARLLELVGIRHMHALLSWLTGDTMLPPVGKPSPWSYTKLAENRDGSRYFGIANLIRGSFYIWPFFAVYQLGMHWLTGLIVFLWAYHYASVLLEIYKIARVNELIGYAPDVGEDPPPNRSNPKWDWWFAPKRWETERFFTIIGVIPLKGIVTTYVDKTKQTVEEQREGKKTEYIKNKFESLNFEFGTRVGECLHGAAFLFNLPVVIGLIALKQPGPAFLIGFIAWSDIMLALLQRCHRLRIWRIVVKMRTRT